MLQSRPVNCTLREFQFVMKFVRLKISSAPHLMGATLHVWKLRARQFTPRFYPRPISKMKPKRSQKKHWSPPLFSFPLSLSLYTHTKSALSLPHLYTSPRARSYTHSLKKLARCNICGMMTTEGRRNSYLTLRFMCMCVLECVYVCVTALKRPWFF